MLKIKYNSNPLPTCVHLECDLRGFVYLRVQVALQPTLRPPEDVRLLPLQGMWMGHIAGAHVNQLDKEIGKKWKLKKINE